MSRRKRSCFLEPDFTNFISSWVTSYDSMKQYPVYRVGDHEDTPVYRVGDHEDTTVRCFPSR